MDDALLLTRYARTRDADAFTELIRRHGGMVFGTCARVIGDRQRAEDAAQECFLALAEQAGTIRHSLAAWLHRVALHIALRERRRARPDVGVDVAHLPAPQVEAWRHLAPQLDAALDALPEDARELVSRYYLGGSTQAALAAELGVTQATVSRRLQQAVVQLRARLDAQLDDQAVQAALGCALVAPPPALIAACGRIGLAGHHGAATSSHGLGVKVACVLLAAAVAIPLAVRAARPHGPAQAPASHAAIAFPQLVAAAADPQPPAPPAAPTNPLLAQRVTIDVSGWPLDRIVATLADQLDLDGGMQSMPDGVPRRIDTRLEIMPCAGGWPLCDAFADQEPLGAVLARLMAAIHGKLLVSDRIVLVSRPAAFPYPLPTVLSLLWGDASRDWNASQAWLAMSLIAQSGDADAVADLVGALASPAMDALTARQPAAARTCQELILRSVASCGGSWQSWLPAGDQMRILGSLAPARAGVIAAVARCRAQRFPIDPCLLYLAGQVGGEALCADLAWVATDPAAALPGLTGTSDQAPILLATERAWAIKALGRAGHRQALPLIREACTRIHGYDVQLAGEMALGECGDASDANLIAGKPLAGTWLAGTTAYVAAAHLAPERLDTMIALPGAIHWGEADAFIGYPLASKVDDILANAAAPQWWVRWAMWKGTGRLDPSLVDTAIRAHAAHGAPVPELMAILARDGDDQALDALVDAMRADPGVFIDAEARRVEDVAQELAARLTPTRQRRACSRLRAGLDWSRVTDAALSMLRAQSTQALADELMAHWPEAAAQGGGAAPAILRALAQMRLDRARAFILARLAEPSGARLCPRALAYEDLADPALRALLLPLLMGKDEGLAIALASCGMAGYPDTGVAAFLALARNAAALTHDDLQRVRSNIACTEGQLPWQALQELSVILGASGDTAVRKDCCEFSFESGKRQFGQLRVLALETELAGMRDRDGAVAGLARKRFAQLRQLNPFWQDDSELYAEHMIMAGSMDVDPDFARTDALINGLQRLAQSPSPASAAPHTSTPARGAAASSNF